VHPRTVFEDVISEMQHAFPNSLKISRLLAMPYLHDFHGNIYIIPKLFLDTVLIG
jgi:hypothetical protein